MLGKVFSEWHVNRERSGKKGENCDRFVTLTGTCPVYLVGFPTKFGNIKPNAKVRSRIVTTTGVGRPK